MINKIDVKMEGGVNTFLDPSDIGENQLQGSPNIAYRIGQHPGLRPSMSFAREVVRDYRAWNSERANQFSDVDPYHTWAKQWRPMKFLFSPIGGEIAGVFQAQAGRTMTQVNNDGTTTPSTLADNEAVLWMLPGVDSGNGPYGINLGLCTRAPSLFLFNGIIWAFGGSNEGGHIVKTTSGVTGPLVGYEYGPNVWNTAQADAFVPDGAAVIRDRVLYYKGSTIYWSDKGDPLQIYEDVLTSGGIIVTGEEQESITAASEISTSADGSPVQSVAAVWTKSRMFMLLGEPLQTIDDASVEPITGSLQINRLNIEAGCISQSTVVRTPYGTLWCGLDDVWFMPSGQLPVRVGTAIRDVIRRQPPSLHYRLFAEYADGFYRLSVFAEGAGPDSFSPLSQQWWLNLNEGPEKMQWWGPMNLNNSDIYDYGSAGQNPESGTFAMARDTREGGDGLLYSLQPYVMFGSNDVSESRVVGMSLAQWTAYNGRDTAAPTRDIQRWAANTVYSAGDEVVPPPSTADFRCPTWVVTSGGTSGGTEPDWMASTAASITDGTVTWRPIYASNNGDGTATFYPMSSYKPTSAMDNDIEWELNSREYRGEDASVEKLLDGAEIVYAATLPMQITYSTSPDQTSRSRILTQYGSAVDAVTNEIAPSGRKQRKLLSADPLRRFSALEAVAKLHADAGIVIVEGFNDTFLLGVDGDLVETECILTPGYYADIQAVWVQLRLDIFEQHNILLTSTFDEDFGFVSRARFGMKDQNGVRPIGLFGYTPLAGYFGFTLEQAGVAAASAGTYYYSNWSPLKRLVSDFQIAQLRLRFGVFGRGPV